MIMVLAPDKRAKQSAASKATNEATPTGDAGASTVDNGKAAETAPADAATGDEAAAAAGATEGAAEGA
jgi:hypothetical protein